MPKRKNFSDQATDEASDSGPRIKPCPRSNVQRQSTLEWNARGLHVTPSAVGGTAVCEEEQSRTTPTTTKQPKLSTTSVPTKAKLGPDERRSSPNSQEFKYLFNQMLKSPHTSITLGKVADPTFRDLVAYVNPAMLPWLAEAIEEARAAQIEGEEVM